MFLIEPCCSQKHLRALRNSIANGGTAQFEGYGDLSLAELLGPLVNHYSGTHMLIATPTLPDQAAEVIDKWMYKQWARMDGRGKVDAISHLTIIAKLEKEKSGYISKWTEKQPFGDRLTLVDIEQDETAILFPDFAITGPVNMRYGHHFIATATTVPKSVKALWERYEKMSGAELAPASAPEPEAELKPEPKPETEVVAEPGTEAEPSLKPDAEVADMQDANPVKKKSSKKKRVSDGCSDD